MRGIFICASIFLICFSAESRAQTYTGSLVGVVEDVGGGRAPRAQLLLTGSAGRYLTSTDNKGEYSFKDIRAGYYDLSARLAGFQDYRARILVPSYGSVSLRVTLQIGNGPG